MELLYRLLLPLLLTLVIEIPIYFVFNKKSFEYLLVIYVMNIVLNLLMNVLLIFVFNSHYAIALVIMEIIIFLSEGFIIFWFKNIRYKGFIIALGANLASLGIGLAFNHFRLLMSLPLIMSVILTIIFVIEFVLIFLHIINSSKASEKQ
ncbi:MAG: hypothetical protein WCX85_03820 [Bacilli bacterium]|jgi:hypothetical protein